MDMKQEQAVLRELAKRYAAIAADDRNRERRERAQGINSLRAARPIVWLDEIPWHEMDIDGALTCVCESPEARELETWLRRMLYRWQYIQADMVAEPFYPLQKAYDDTGYGIEVQETTLSISEGNNIISHRYDDLLAEESSVALFHMPVITARPDVDAHRMQRAQELLGDTLPVHLRGHAIYHAPWDQIPRLRGVEPILYDMVDRPEHLHNIRRFYMEAELSRYAQMTAQGLLGFDIANLHCTPPYVDDLPAPDYAGGAVRLKDVWFRGMAQMFSTVSPSMWEEFELAYARPLMEQCGLSYYGCCEPLDAFLPLLKTVPNMRKLGVSPWSNVRFCAEQLGRDYVMARKPNPAHVSGFTNEEAVRREIAETAEACLANQCAYEFVLKDISTVSRRPENLVRWVRVVTETLDRYYA